MSKDRYFAGQSLRYTYNAGEWSWAQLWKVKAYLYRQRIRDLECDLEISKFDENYWLEQCIEACIAIYKLRRGEDVAQGADWMPPDEVIEGWIAEREKGS